MSGFVAFGEILLRFSPPGRERLLQTPRLDVWIGGAEANVMTALARLGHPTSMISAVPDDALGDAAVATLRGHGVATDGVRRAPGRMATYYVTGGAGWRATDVLYDRATSAFQEVPPAAWDWPQLLAGNDRLHLSGVTTALSPATAAAALAAARAANSIGIKVSFDCNYRSILWARRNDEPAAALQAVIAEADILFGNHHDLNLVLGCPVEPRAAANAAFAAFDRLQMIVSTKRRSDEVDVNYLSGRIETRGATLEAPEIRIAGIVDRVGTGDAFAAGVLHALDDAEPLPTVAATGLALAALKHSLPGDASLFSRADLAAAIRGGRDIRR